MDIYCTCKPTVLGNKGDKSSDHDQLKHALN